MAIVAVLVAGSFGAVCGWLATRAVLAARVAGLQAERDVLRERIIDLEATVSEDAQTAATLAPLRETLSRVEQHVHVLERDRVEHYGQLGARLAEVSSSTASLRLETAALAVALNATTTRGAWGEVQLRRVLEHAGMLPRCDFDEQVSVVSGHGRAIRPDVVVHLPGDRHIVIDAKVPMTAYLSAHAEDIDPDEREQLLADHAAALRRHIDSLAAKQYWSGFASSPEFVVCFVPSDAILAAALTTSPDVFDHALARKVILASPATLLALLRTIALSWQQDALHAGAAELLELGTQLYGRLATLGKHTSAMGGALVSAVEHFNSFVGTLESRVLVTARRMNELGLAAEPLQAPTVRDVHARGLTAPELFAALGEVASPVSDASSPLPQETLTGRPSEAVTAPDDWRLSG